MKNLKSLSVALHLTSNNGNRLNANILPGKEKNKVGFQVTVVSTVLFGNAV